MSRELECLLWASKSCLYHRFSTLQKRVDASKHVIKFNQIQGMVKQRNNFCTVMSKDELVSFEWRSKNHVNWFALAVLSSLALRKPTGAWVLVNRTETASLRTFLCCSEFSSSDVRYLCKFLVLWNISMAYCVIGNSSMLISSIQII